MDSHSDLWSVGVLVYQMVAHKLPFEEPTKERLERRIRSAQPPDPLPAACPEPLRRIIFKMLARDPVRRYQTALEVNEDLARFQNGQQVSSLRVWKGADDAVSAGFVADQYVTLPKGQAQKLKLTMEAVEPLVAPVAKGQPVGVVKVTLEGKPVGEYPLVALGDVAPANLFGRAWDTVRLWFK